MKLIVKEILNKENLSVRALAERMPDGNPSYRTIDEFIRRGGGTLATAAPIAKGLGRTIDAIYVEDDCDLDSAMDVHKNVPQHNTIHEIVAICVNPETVIDKDALSKIGMVLGNNGFISESEKCFNRASEMLETGVEYERKNK